MAFDAAAAGSRSTPASRSGISRPGGGGLDSSSSYQSADRQYIASCEAVEKELRKLTITVTATRKLVDVIGSPRDSDDTRKKLQLNLDKSKESSKILSDLLKSDLAQAVDAPEINQRERGARKQQLARFQKDFQEAMQSFQDTATAAATAVKRHAVPSSSSASDSGRSSAATKVGKGKVGGEGLDDPFLQRMQQVEFDSAMVEERDEAINDIAQSIMEVNETMRDLANIVDEQGKDIDQIEVNTTNAEDNTEKGVGFLTDAEKYQKGYRKWILVLVCIIVVAAGGAAGAYVGLKH